MLASCIFIAAILGANLYQAGTLNYDYLIPKTSAKGVDVEKSNTYEEYNSPEAVQQIEKNDSDIPKNITPKKNNIFKNKFWLFKKVNPDENLKGGKGWLIALTIIVGFVLIVFLIIPLSCSLICVGIGLESVLGGIIAGGGYCF